MRGRNTILLYFLLVFLLSQIFPANNVITTDPPIYIGDSNARDKVLVGFTPYWTISGYTPRRLFDYLIFFDAPVNGDGSIDTSRIDAYLDDIERINSTCNCTFLIALTCFNQDDQDSILGLYLEDFKNNIINLINTYGFEGINLDFEFMRDTNSITGGDNSDYLLELFQYLKSQGLIVSIDVAGGVETVYRDSRLASYVDFVFLMGYDFHWSTAPTSGPVSPFMSSREFDVDDSLSILDNYYPLDKIVLGLPLYGYDWPTVNDQPYSDTSGAGTARRYAQIINNYAPVYGVRWDDVGHTTWILYYDSSGGSWRQIWFDNITSLAMKIDYVRLENYSGFGFWALGYEAYASDEELLWWMVSNRSYRPYIHSVFIHNDVVNGNLTINVSDMFHVEYLNITVIFDDAPQIDSYSLGVLGSRFKYFNYSVVDNSLILSFRYDGFPGNGVNGSGLLVSIGLSNSGRVVNVSIWCGSRLLIPDNIVYENGSVVNIYVENTPIPIGEDPLVVYFAVLISLLLVFYIFNIFRRNA